MAVGNNRMIKKNKCKLFSVGIDSVTVSRFRKFKKSSPFIKKYYSKNEINYCFMQVCPEESLAARYAAKEATVKAMYGLNKPISMNKLEVLMNKGGYPEMKLNNEDKNIKVSISLTHTKTMAMAISLIYV
jgi:holo-[acyl-carrier protein] synthase